ncbi:MAG: glycosyltransferase family 1 protein [Bacteroidota bacterium]
MEVQLFYRKHNASNFSIEGIFNNLYEEFDEVLKNENAKVSKIEVPYFSNKKTSIIKNIFFSRSNVKDVNHITGDIHYVALGLPVRSTVLTVHDCVTLTRKRNPITQWFIKKLWFDWAVGNVQYITVISEKTKTELIQYTGCSPEKIVIIPNPYNPIFAFKKLAFNREKPHILQIGTRDNKNLENIILAIENINCKLIIIGKTDSNQKKMLRNGNIDYEECSNISNEEMYQRYVQADLVTFVSFYEGFGMPIIEAQAVGRPVLTSNIPPMNTISKDSALHVDPFSVEAIRNGIQKIIEDNEFRENLIIKGLENVKKYSREIIAQQYLDLYKKIHTKN